LCNSSYGTAERSGEHVALEPESDQPRSLGHHAAARREEIRNGDSQRLREKQEHDHGVTSLAAAGGVTAASLRRRSAVRSTRRTSGTDAATAMITTACSTSTICLGTTAFTASPPCEIVAKASAASSTPNGLLRPT